MLANDIARKFMMLSVLNGFLAIVFTIPILIPNLCIATPMGQFGCKASMEIVWPGTWVLVAWFVFLIVGVLGALYWSLLYQAQGTMMNKTESRKSLSWLHLVLFEVGLLGATGLMAAIGYVGGNILAQGGGQAIAAQAIAQNIIPPLSSDPSSLFNDMPPVVEALFIGVSILAQLVGMINLLTMKKVSSP